MTALLLLAAAQAPPGVAVAKTDTTLAFTAGGRPVTTYRFAGEVQEEKSDRRKPLAKPVFFPLLAPGGVPVTRGWPLERGAKGETVDHYHQKSVWFCHGDVEPGWLTLTTKSADGRPGAANFWSETPGHGRIVCVQVGEPTADGPTRVTVPTRNEWRVADGTRLLDETRVLTVSDHGAGVLIALDVTLTAADGPITFGDTKEGSMGVRVHDELRTAAKKDGLVTSSDGTTAAAPKDNLPVWGRAADWHDYSGTVAGTPVGLAVFDHPGNQPRAAWHTRAYGLMAANPFGRSGSKFPLYADRTDLVKLPKGASLRLRYGVYAHAGDAAAGKVAEVFAGFAR